MLSLTLAQACARIISAESASHHGPTTGLLLCARDAHMSRLDQASTQNRAGKSHLGTSCLNLLLGTEAARLLLKLIGVHTSFEWVCIWTRSSFSPFLLFPEENEQFCEAGVLFNSKTVQLPSPPPTALYKRKVCILKLVGKRVLYSTALFKQISLMIFSSFTWPRCGVNGC